jgi:hypothetical protein
MPLYVFRDSDPADGGAWDSLNTRTTSAGIKVISLFRPQVALQFEFRLSIASLPFRRSSSLVETRRPLSVYRTTEWGRLSPIRFRLRNS